MNTIRIILTLLAAALLSGPALAQSEAGAAGLAHRLDQAESIRAVKRLEVSQAQFIQYRLWDNVEQLYSSDAEATFGDEHARGPAAIRAQWQAIFGDLPEGPTEGVLSVELVMTPVVTMLRDGDHARGRWHVVTLGGRLGGDARWTGAIMENEYQREDGVWRISRVRYYPQFAGPYEQGWTNLTDDLEIVPYHYTPAQAGTPIPHDAAPPAAVADVDPASIASRVGALNAEDEVRNLQNIYGYYVDRKMWDDVGDLFEADGTLEIAGLGRWNGAASIRRGLERDGPPGLREGEVNDRVQVNMTVTIDRSGDQATARGLEFGMVGQNGGDAFWTIATFENDYVRRDGTWRIARMRLYPQMRTNYYMGWARSWLPEPQPADEHAPDLPLPALHGAQFPAFRAQHPTTGESVVYPTEAEPVAAAGGLPRVGGVPLQTGDLAPQLARAIGYDAVEHISSAFGNWLDDFQWRDLAALFARDGIRLSPTVGYYVGPERIRAIQEARYGPPRQPRMSIPMHLRTQPVIVFGGDPSAALLRTRLLQFNSNFGSPGSMTSGIYNDSARVEDGTWKFAEVLIRHLWRSPNYAAGWARVPAGSGRQAAGSVDALLERFPPDRPLVEDGLAPFPEIGPICFPYANPVTGRRSDSSPASGCGIPPAPL